MHILLYPYDEWRSFGQWPLVSSAPSNNQPTSQQPA
jgi:hypothetical protein